MVVINNEIINNIVTEEGRIYLCGGFAQNGSFKHYMTDGYELGLSYYGDFTFDKPHFHRHNTEYNYLLSGRAKVLMIEDHNEIEVKAGDLYIIEKNEPYAVKSMSGTRILFTKEPGGNDKELITMTKGLARWGLSWSASYKVEV